MTLMLHQTLFMLSKKYLFRYLNQFMCQSLFQLNKKSLIVDQQNIMERMMTHMLLAPLIINQIILTLITLWMTQVVLLIRKSSQIKVRLIILMKLILMPKLKILKLILMLQQILILKINTSIVESRMK